MSEPRLPNFFIAGAPKAGTTSLYHHLRQHPQIYLSPLKETSYFSTEFRVQNLAPELQAKGTRNDAELTKYFASPPLVDRFGGWVTNAEDYSSLFLQAGKALAIGEASPSYLWSVSAAYGIAQAVPEARIIVILRDPVERAFSQYRQMFSTGQYGLSFDEHIQACLAARNTNQVSMIYPFLEYGLYHEQVRRYRSLFGKDRLGVWLYEDTAKPTFLPQLFAFLGVDNRFVPDTSIRYLQQNLPRFPAIQQLLGDHAVASTMKRLVPTPVRSLLNGVLYRPGAQVTMSAGARRQLIRYYHADVISLAKLLGRDLSHWLSD